MQSEALTRLANMHAHGANTRITSPRSRHSHAHKTASPTLRLFAFPPSANSEKVLPPQPSPDGLVSPLTLQHQFTGTSTIAGPSIASALEQSRASAHPASTSNSDRRPTKVSLVVKTIQDRLAKSGTILISTPNAVPVLDVSTLNENCPSPLFSRSTSKRPYKPLRTQEFRTQEFRTQQVRTHGTAIVPRRVLPYPEICNGPGFSPRPCQSPLPFSPSKRKLRQNWAWQFGDAVFRFPTASSTDRVREEMLSPKTIGGEKDGSPRGFANFGDMYEKGSIVGLGRSGRGRKRTFEEFEEVEGRVEELARGVGAGELEGVADEVDVDDEEFDDPDDFYDEYDWLSVAGEEDLMNEHAVDAREMC